MTKMTITFAIGLIAGVACTTPSLAQSTRGPFAQVPSRSQVVVNPQRRSTNPTNDAYQNGHYVGSDPDPFIRDQVRNDPDHNAAD